MLQFQPYSPNSYDIRQRSDFRGGSRRPRTCWLCGRTALLRAQFAHMGTHIVGIQEARSVRADCVVSDTFIRICSADLNPVILVLRLGFAGDSLDPLTFETEDLTWTPRLLCIRVRSKAVRILVVVLHAPTARSAVRGGNTPAGCSSSLRGGSLFYLWGISM